jgi:hypothetical protein
MDDEMPEGLKDGRSCEVYGHHWDHMYGGALCRHCGAETFRREGPDK